MQTNDATTAAPALKPGYATTEGWISLLVVVLGALPTTVLANTSPLWVQIVGLIAASVTAIAHSTNRTALKRAHLQLGTPSAGPVPEASGQPVAPKGFARTSIMYTLALIATLTALAFYTGCSGAQHAAEKQALSCVEQAGESDLVPTVETILQTGASSWELQLEALAAKFGLQTVGCAVQLADQLFAPPAGSAMATKQPANPDAAARAAQFLHEHFTASS